MSKRKEGQLIGSDDYIESLQAVAADPYDNSSWSTVIDELEAGRGGNGDYEEIMGKFLVLFPCAALYSLVFACICFVLPCISLHLFCTLRIALYCPLHFVPSFKDLILH